MTSCAVEAEVGWAPVLLLELRFERTCFNDYERGLTSTTCLL